MKYAYSDGGSHPKVPGKLFQLGSSSMFAGWVLSSSLTGSQVVSLVSLSTLGLETSGSHTQLGSICTTVLSYTYGYSYTD